MEQWLESVYSDGSDCFVSKMEPNLFDTVRIRIRMYEDAPVKHVLLRTVPNGAERFTEAKELKREKGLIYYEAEITMTEPRMQYQFYLVCDNVIYYYNQKEITTYIPDQTYDFVLLADYRQPTWVKNSVFYQIFPDRFYNGNEDNDVQDGEYQLNGHDTIKMKSWTDEPLPYEKGFCLDFYGGDLEGIEKKIPYLKKLGVNAVYLNPIFDAPTVHKYDCIDYFHVDKHFGGDEALERLSKTLHDNDMKLILDISINHTGTAHKWFNRDGLFFDKSVGAYNNKESKEREYYFINEKDNTYTGWFGVSDLPTLNYTSTKLREIIYENTDSVIRKWLKPPYNIDGWRFDVADVFARNDEIQLAHEIWPKLRESIRLENPEAYILAEDWGDCAQYLQGNEWDSAMNYYGCGRIIRQFVGEQDLFNNRNEILKKVSYRMTGKDVKARVMQHLSKLPFVMWQNQFNLIDSHDVPRLHNNPKAHKEEYRGAVMFLFTLIGCCSIYYGDEALVDGVYGTNEGCRYPMPWHNDFENSENFKLYQTLTKLKTSKKAFSDGGMKFLYADDDVIGVTRFCEDEAFVMVMSVSEEERKIVLPLGVVGASHIKEDKDIFGRSILSRKIDNNHVELTISPHGAYLMECIMK